tara:strand:+ start:3268 stop:3936 length:669 start_codon:yes stop_codon:yes gene_type:complete
MSTSGKRSRKGIITSKVAVGKVINVYWAQPYNRWFAGVVTDISKKGTKINYNDGDVVTHKRIEFMRYEVFDDTNEQVSLTPFKQKRLHEVATEELKCGICLTLFTNPYTPKGCPHAFCYACISRWIQEPQRNTCPLCTTKIVSMRDCHANPILEKLANSIRSEACDNETGAGANALLTLSTFNGGVSEPITITKKAGYRCHKCHGIKKHRHMSCNPKTCVKY